MPMTDKSPIIVAGRDIQSVITIARYEITEMAEQVAAELALLNDESVEAQDAYPAVLAYVEHQLEYWLSGMAEEAANDSSTVPRIFAAYEKRRRDDQHIPPADGGV